MFISNNLMYFYFKERCPMNETRKSQKLYKLVSVYLFKMLSLLGHRLMPLFLGASQRKLPSKSLLSVIMPQGRRQGVALASGRGTLSCGLLGISVIDGVGSYTRYFLTQVSMALSTKSLTLHISSNFTMNSWIYCC